MIVKREVRVEVGPDDARKVLIFRLGINEMIALQSEWGIKDDEEFLNTFDRPGNLARYRSIVKKALVIHQKDITDESVGDIITELGMPRMKEILDETTAWVVPDPSSAPTRSDG